MMRQIEHRNVRKITETRRAAVEFSGPETSRREISSRASPKVSCVRCKKRASVLRAAHKHESTIHDRHDSIAQVEELESDRCAQSPLGGVRLALGRLAGPPAENMCLPPSP